MAATSTIQISRFHASDAKYMEYSYNTLEKKIKSGMITEDDAALIREFVAEARAVSQISNSRAFKLHVVLTQLREFVGPYRTNTIADVYSAIDAIKNVKNPDGSPRYKKNTIGDFIRFLKRFHLWLVENHYSTIDEKKLSKIHTPGYDTMTKTAEQMLSEDQIKAMIQACQISRDRALIACLYEGGFRVGELGKLTWKQVKFTDWNVVINVNDKTERPRFIPLVMARSYLAQWKNDYPGEITDEGFVFLTNGKHQSLQYRGVAKQLSKIAERAGIEQHITPHIFRHSRITHLIQQGCSESIIKKMMWGNIITKQFATYAHLTDTDTENEIARMNGITTPDKKKKSESLEPRQCPRCFTVNGPTLSFCGNCGLELTEEAMDKVKQAKEQGELQPEYQVIFDRFKAELLQMQAKNQA
jgi:site-specific recombinase XerD